MTQNIAEGFSGRLLVVWHSGSIVCCMNKVTLHWAQLVLGWVTIWRWIYHPGPSM